MTGLRDLPRCLATLALQGLLCPVAGLSAPVGCWLVLAVPPFAGLRSRVRALREAAA